MASLNTSTNGPNITRSYQNVVNTPPPTGAQANSPTYGQWAVFVVTAPLVSAFQHEGGKESVLKVQSTGGTSPSLAPPRPQCLRPLFLQRRGPAYDAMAVPARLQRHGLIHTALHATMATQPANRYQRASLQT